MKTALVFDWLTNLGGDIRVAQALGELYPDADIFASLYNPSQISIFNKRKVTTSFLQKIPGSRNNHQLFIPLMPLAVENYDLRSYDLVISASHAAAKGVITKPETIHIDYCFTPIRYIWEPEIDQRLNKAWVLKKPLQRYLKSWDRQAADRVDFFSTISTYTASRIKKYYTRSAQIISPPVDTDQFYPLNIKRADFFLSVGRLIEYKRYDLAIKTCNQLGEKLVIVGVGPELERLKKLANPRLVKFTGAISDPALNRLYNQARALIFPSEEDFGIVPIEAMSAGTPVIAYSQGGALDTVIADVTGIFFNRQTVGSLVGAIKQFSQKSFSRPTIINHAKRFSQINFKKNFSAFVNQIRMKKKKGLIWA